MLKKMMFSVLAVVALFPFVANAQLKYVEGTDYTALKQPIEQTDKPKIIEFFWFGCPHCNAMRPALEGWLKDGKAEAVEFEFVPAVSGSPFWDLPAQAYYTMKELKLDLYDQYFDEMFVKNNRGVIASATAIKTFFVKEGGVDAEAFDKAWNSFAVKQALQRASNLFEKSGLDGVPAFIVNGKYVVQPKGDNEEAYKHVFNVLDALAK